MAKKFKINPIFDDVAYPSFQLLKSCAGYNVEQQKLPEPNVEDKSLYRCLNGAQERGIDLQTCL